MDSFYKFSLDTSGNIVLWNTRMESEISPGGKGLHFFSQGLFSTSFFSVGGGPLLASFDEVRNGSDAVQDIVVGVKTKFLSGNIISLDGQPVFCGVDVTDHFKALQYIKELKMHIRFLIF